jgi:hypothetical protein
MFVTFINISYHHSMVSIHIIEIVYMGFRSELEKIFALELESTDLERKNTVKNAIKDLEQKMKALHAKGLLKDQITERGQDVVNTLHTLCSAKAKHGKDFMDVQNLEWFIGNEIIHSIDELLTCIKGVRIKINIELESIKHDVTMLPDQKELDTSALLDINKDCNAREVAWQDFKEKVSKEITSMWLCSKLSATKRVHWASDVKGGEEDIQDPKRPHKQLTTSRSITQSTHAKQIEEAHDKQGQSQGRTL